MDAQPLLYYLLLLCLGGYSSAQMLLASDAQGYTTKPVEITCQVEDFLPNSLEIIKLSGNISRHSITLVNSTRTVLSIAAVQESDGGIYRCSAISQFNTLSRDITLMVTTYQMLQRDGPVGQIMTSTENMERIRCPVTGMPLPSEIFWQKGLARNDPNITTTRGEGPFVGDDGYLDLTTSTSEDEDGFRCTAVNIFGDRVSQTFYITIVRQPSVIVWLEWYLILVYCVVGCIVFAVLALCLWCCCTCCCTRVDSSTEKEKEEKVSARPVPLFTRSPLPLESGIDDYATGDESFGY